MASLLVNGRDVLTELGLRVAAKPRFRDSPTRSIAGVSLVGRMGGMAAGASFGVLPTLVVDGTTIGDTYSARVALEDKLKDLALSGLVTLTWADGVTTRQIVGLASPGVQFSPAGVDGRSRAVRATVSFSCPDPTWSDLEPTLVAMPTAGTRYSIALGTAPSAFLLRIMGASTNPVATYRTASGSAAWTLTFGATSLTASTHWLSLESTTGNIRKYSNSATPTDAIGELTSGQQDWSRASLNPQDGDYTTSQWPTLEVSSGSAEVLYWKRWL